VDPLGNLSDSASPVDTSTPTPTEEEPSPSVTPTVTTPTVTSTSASPTGTDDALAACLDGNWSAPVSREFSALGLSQRSKGAVRSGTGVLRLTLGNDRTFSFTYDHVVLRLPAGTANVNGPVSGTWSLSGSMLDTVLIKSATEVTVSLGPVTVGAPSAVTSALETLPPSQVGFTCTDSLLTMQLPSSQGGGTVTFDRA
jgi:phage baseplate assembly protein gpV